jgi:hypothetical protein
MSEDETRALGHSAETLRNTVAKYTRRYSERRKAV